ncbi:MAG TPA: neutral zinc metallopeptidase [Vicinamibacterales bacterium]|nr:neutral zinc metallopeptidase [Vicinamibacterales bacterium]
MRWESGGRSKNIEDRRGLGGAGMVGGGGIGMLVLVLVISFISGRNPLELLSQVEQSAPAGNAVPAGEVPANDPQAQRVSFVLHETEQTWTRIFQQNRGTYQEPVLVLFDGSVRSACGSASSAVGPFYCPADQKVYLDLSFFRELDARFGAPGDFAEAYVIAHEVGHHVQTLLGVSDKVNQARSRMSQEEGNQMSVRQELQADCYAGVWGFHTNSKNLLEPGDIDEGLSAAAAIGDDRLQKQGQGYVSPESWTHGSAQQRQRWLRRGLDSGDINQCDTFSAGAI